MTAAKDELSIVTTAPAPQPIVNVKVLEPFQIYWDRTIYVGGDTVDLPADVADRHELAGWITRTN